MIVLYGREQTKMSDEDLKFTDGVEDLTYFRAKVKRALKSSHLSAAEKAKKQLELIEDSIITSKFTKCPAKRAFDHSKDHEPLKPAEEYMREMMQRHKDKTKYDKS